MESNCFLRHDQFPVDLARIGIQFLNFWGKLEVPPETENLQWNPGTSGFQIQFTKMDENNNSNTKSAQMLGPSPPPSPRFEGEYEFDDGNVGSDNEDDRL